MTEETDIARIRKARMDKARLDKDPEIGKPEPKPRPGRTKKGAPRP